MSRADRLTELLDREGLDLLLVTDLTNLRYLTGFTGTNGMAVVGREHRRFVTDFRYVEQAAAQVTEFDREEGPRDFVTALGGGWPEGAKRVGFEDHKVSIRQHARIREVMPAGIELVPAGALVEELRAVKEAQELDAIRAASQLADAALTTILERGVVGRPEREIALELEHEMRRQGADEPSFASIVASAERGARPHAGASGEPIPAGTLLTIDWGAKLDGYCSDCTRTFATGEVSDELAEIYALTQRAQQAALDAVAPGPTGAEVDRIARDIISAEGHGEHFGHGLGHGVGLEVHEGPTLSAQRGDDALVSGHVVTVEPGIYIPGVGGVRIEDLAFVTVDGHDVATGLSKDLQIIT
jgi:Xaa-Pro aminopeptidase